MIILILVHAYSITTLFSIYPNPSIATRTTSPSFKYTYGERTNPTPSGVPVNTIVPFFSVVPDDKNDTNSATFQIMSAVLEFYRSFQRTARTCITELFRRVEMCARLITAFTSLPRTICGPMGLNVSKDFARVH